MISIIIILIGILIALYLYRQNNKIIEETNININKNMYKENFEQLYLPENVIIEDKIEDKNDILLVKIDPSEIELEETEEIIPKIYGGENDPVKIYNDTFFKFNDYVGHPSDLKQNKPIENLPHNAKISDFYDYLTT